jgi:SAM-dependent methyltransferase
MSWATDPTYLAYQYGDAERLRVRIETHERYSERASDWYDWVVAQLGPQPGLTVLDVGCGPGTLHSVLARHDVRILGLDASAGMLREARAHAVEARLPVALMRGDAEALPLRDATCDRVLASHMLYHIPDLPRALGEMRRVLKPGGRVVLTTNASDHSSRLHDVHARVARRLGYTPTARSMARFTLDDLPLVRSAFPSAERRLSPNAFLFPTPVPVLRYYASGLVDAIQERAPDGSHRPELLRLFEAEVEGIVAKDGVFRVPKDAGCFVAELSD